MMQWIKKHFENLTSTFEPWLGKMFNRFLNLMLFQKVQEKINPGKDKNVHRFFLFDQRFPPPALWPCLVILSNLRTRPLSLESGNGTEDSAISLSNRKIRGWLTLSCSYLNFR